MDSRLRGNDDDGWLRVIDLWRSWSWRAKAWAGAALLLFGAFTALWFVTLPPPLPGYAQTKAGWAPSEAWLYDRNGRLIDSARVNFSVRRLAWTPLESVTPVLPQTIIASEDRRFASHDGVDWWAMAGSLRDRLEGKRARGASTLSMQVAAFLAPQLAAPGSRGWRDKARQMRAAMDLEDDWSKDQILEAYLNLAGYRGEAQGIGASALSLFGKAPDALTKTDALLMAALLPNPRAGPQELGRRACLLASQNRTGQGCLPYMAAALDMLGPARRLALDPGLAPHLANRLLKTPGMKITTTLDMDIQRMAVTALSRQLQGLGSDRARDGAVLVVDNATGDVLAYVGGVGGSSTASAVDGANSYRQAGSTLKPFLYAQAIEKGYLTPASILDDSPVQLDTASGLYVPQNYDHDFKGPVSARTALAGSLNVPAVRTLVLAGVDSFRDRLWDTGYRGLTEDGQYYGFSLALGSAEVTLMEQAAAYRTLAKGGRWSPLRLRADDKKEVPRAIFSSQSAWIVSDMMSDADARAQSFGLDSALRLSFWSAVKTGTSKAMRDNWCIGFSDRYTVAVWVGNLEGDSMRAVSGTAGAAPVWRDLMLALHQGHPGRQPAQPSGIETRQVRFADGIEPPRREYFLAGTGQSVIGVAPRQSRRPRITSPVGGSVYALDPDIPIQRQRMAIQVAGAVEGFRLILDKKDLGPADARPQVLAGPGAHRLQLVDPAGKVVDSLLFTVR
ncbi:penicillin-binding protein 1C [Sphingobium boeckii]|uniref:peptidoglycan glycosyltransferase n=1 Tax=Sphingobium boeckii TaxID=1082345 RepID=A0A7W9AL07_9SPHN|nr:penicillin-binding protein 1C [Sphingobium boeckii]MBB5687615.1 penicillin-binding protein 1C [Sphingobium boeckii]